LPDEFAPNPWEVEAVSSPRYRTLDGVELDLPVYLDRWVLVPSLLARGEEDLTWTLDCEDVPSISPQMRDGLGGDPALDFSEGALLVPLARWNQRATTEPALIASKSTATGAEATSESIVAAPAPPPDSLRLAMPRESPPHGMRVIGNRERAERLIVRSALATVDATLWAISALAFLIAVSFGVALGQWLLALRDGVSGADVGSGAVLLVGGMALAYAAGLLSRGRAAHRPLILGVAARAVFNAGALVIMVVFVVLASGLAR
jgi:hypothetical protein